MTRDLDPDRNPLDELELLDQCVEHAAKDEQRTMFDDSVQPRPHRRGDPSDPAADGDGRPFDLQDATSIVDDLALDIDDPGVDVDLMADTDDVETKLGVLDL